LFFFFFFGVEAAGLFRATEQLLLSASFSKGMDGWMRKKTLKQKNVSFFSFFSFSLRDSVRRRHLFRGVLFFFPFKKQNKKSVAPTTTGLNQATSVLRKTPVREKKKNCTRFIFHPSSRKRKFFFQEK
jgi:hypothetical protein